MSKSELVDFNNICKGFGNNSDDFIVSSVEDPAPYGALIYERTGTVTVTHKHNNKTKAYKAGHGASWISKFRKDMEEAYFFVKSPEAT